MSGMFPMPSQKGVGLFGAVGALEGFYLIEFDAESRGDSNGEIPS